MSERPFRFIHREIVILLALCALAVVGFLVTRSAATSNDERLLADAVAWYDTGLRALDEGRTAEAVDALRRATFIDDEDRDYHLTLARALAADGQDPLARTELLALRASAPEDPEVNLELARLEARRADLDAAVRYYTNALYGVWPDPRADERSHIRVELIRYLLDRGEDDIALGEILALTGSMPTGAVWAVAAADLFLAAGDPARALEAYEEALAGEPDNGAALAGAGRAAFALDDFVRARGLLARAPDELEDVRTLREVVDLVLARDPLAARLSTDERRRRLLENVARTEERLTACAPAAGVNPALALVRKALADFAPQLEPDAFRDQADAVETGVGLVARAHLAADRACGAPTPLDRALSIIGRLHADAS